MNASPHPKPENSPPAENPLRGSNKRIPVALGCLVPYLLALCVVLFGWASIGVTPAVTVGVWMVGFVLTASFLAGMLVRPWRPLAWFSAFFVVLGLLFLPAPSGSGDRSRQSQCSVNLKRIGLALHDYHDVHKCFPPAYVADAEGRPLYSWRVLLLPYLEEKPLYEQFHLDEPWDSPHNIDLVPSNPDAFSCPSDDHEGSFRRPVMTNYLVVVGPDTMWRGTEVLNFASLADGTSNTIAVVEVRNSGVHWAEPREMDVEQMEPGVNPKTGQEISSAHWADGANVLFADGRVEFLPSDIPPEAIRAMLTIAGGEDVDAGGF